MPHDDARAGIHRAGLGLHGAHELRDAEVQDFRAAVAREEQVLGLQVAMDDAAGVRGCQSARNLHGVVDRLSPGDGAVPQTVAEGFTVEQFRDDVRNAALASHVVDHQQVGMVEGAGGLSLPFRSAGRDRGR